MVLSAQAMACCGGNDSEVEWQRCHFCIFSQPPFFGLLCDWQQKTPCPSDRMSLYGKN